MLSNLTAAERTRGLVAREAESTDRTFDRTRNVTGPVPAAQGVGITVHPMHGALLRMQRQHGNRRVVNMMRRARNVHGAGGLRIQRDLLDDFSDEMSNLGAAAVAGAQQAGSAIASGAEAVGEGISSAAGTVGSAIASGAGAVGEGISSAVDTVGSAVQGGAAAIGSAAGGAAQALGSAPASLGEQASGIVDWIKSEAGALALRAAQALARKFGGDVVISPDGGIDILFPNLEIAQIDSETIVLPLGLPTKPLFEAPFEVGTFVINTSVGSVIGDPTVTIAAGPVRLQHVKLHLNPGGAEYAGTGQFFAGSEVVGSGEHATEARVQAIGVLPFEVPIPIEASAAVGIRDILRIAGRENVQETVRVGYSGGRFKVDALTEVKLGALAQLDNEAFVRVEIEGHEVCSVIWPFSSKRLGDAAVKITLPISVTSADEGIVGRIGEPKAAPIPVDEIQTSLTNSRPPTHCIALAELGPLLCKLGKLPPDLCAIVGVAPAGAGNGKTAPKTEPKAGPKPDTVDPLTTPGRRCREETGDPCPTALPVAWPAELPLPAGAGLIRVKGEDVEFPKEKRGAAQERLRKEIARRRRLLLPPPRPCDTNVDNDPNAPRDAHHKQPLALGGRDADENVCALDADLHQVGHPRLNNQVEFLDVYEEECNYCSPRVNDHPAGQTYFIRGRK